MFHIVITLVLGSFDLPSLTLACSYPLHYYYYYYYYCILRCPGGERIVDVVPRRTELEPQVKTGSWAGRKRSQ